MQLHLIDPGRPDFQRAAARDWFDDQHYGQPVLVWTESNLLYGTAPYRGIWRGFRQDFLGGIMGHLELDHGSTQHIGPAGIVRIEPYDPLAQIERRVERLLRNA